MDRHELSHVTAEDVANVHQEDLKIQDQFGCRGLTYWFDEKRGTAFCLIEAPEEGAVKDMHKKAHGMIPNDIIEVDAKLVNAFLGRMENPSSSDDDSEHVIIREPGLRTILISCAEDFTLLKAKAGEEKARSLLKSYNQIINSLSGKYEGREVNCLPDCYQLSFQKAGLALLFAHELQKEFTSSKKNSELKISIGISTGDPVNQSPELFGQTVQLAKRLSHVVAPGHTMISAETMDQLSSDWKQELPCDNVTVLNRDTERFINKLMDIIDSMWDKTEFSIHEFERKLAMSKAQLYRRITAICHFPPNNFIKEFRLKKA